VTVSHSASRPSGQFSERYGSFALTRRAQEKSGIQIAQAIDTPGRRSLFIAPQVAHGLWLEFREK